MASTASELTIEHYQRPEVREIITKFAMPRDGNWRALNGDFHRWYAYDGTEARLLNVEDYDSITGQFRTLYQTLNTFASSLWMVSRTREDITSDNPLGTPADTVAYTLGVDIDKGHGCNIEDPETKQAVEAAAQFLIDYLKENGIHKSVWPLFSGGGIYVKIHHEICCPKSTMPEDRAAFFEELTDRYNRLIDHVSEEFFKAHPEYIGQVKYDALNNSKRIFKCILSIHKSKPYAVTPLNRDDIKIDFGRARVPLKEDMIEEARAWYSSYDPAEREPLLRLLDEFKEAEEEHKAKHHFKEVWRSPFKVDTKYFPPCIKHIIDTANPGEGKTRFSGVLSAFLYQAGWPEEEAWTLVKNVSDRNGLGNADHIFDSCFGRISCPSCQTIQNDGDGYPHLGLKGLGACRPEEECDRWPGDYAIAYAFGDMRAESKTEELKAKGPTVFDALRVLLENESKLLDDKDFKKWEWSLEKSRIEGAVKKNYLSKEDEIELHKFLKNYEKVLAKYGIEYGDLWAIPRPEKSKKEEFNWRIKAKAWKILRSGDPLQELANSCGRVVLGAETAFKKLACCISAQNVRQTAGLHPKFNGESGGGKTYIVYTFANHLPKEMVIKGSMSNKSGFYHKDGNRVLRIHDDYVEGNVDMDTIIKQTSSEFHEPYTHRTVINHQAASLQIGSEQTWAITSVDSSQDIQVLNRQLSINVDDSKELTKKVNDKTVQRYNDGETQQPVDKTVLVQRALFQILRDQGYIDVKVPFGIEWLDDSNRRNPSLFLDLVISITALNRLQREQDSEGFYLATEEDFNCAKALFTDKDAEELIKRLTDRERAIINLLVSHADGLTRDEIGEKLGIVPDRVSQILGGQRGSGGLRQKVQLREEKKSISHRTGDWKTDDTRQTVHKTVYSLGGYNPFTGFDGVVRLKPATEKPAMYAMRLLCNELCNQNDMCNDGICKICIREKEREKKEREESKDTADPLSPRNEENAKLHSLKATDADKAYIADVKPGLGYIAHPTDSGSIEVDLLRAEDARAAKEAKFKTPRRYDVIYAPKGPAGEYSSWACNIVQSPGKDGKGPKPCSHGCLYCYNKPGTEDGPILKPDAVNRLKKDLPKLKQVIQPGQRLQFTFAGDLYDPAIKIARECLSACKNAGIPFQVLTKNGPGAIQDFDLYGPNDLFGVTLTGCDTWEPGAPTTEERIRALKEAHDRKIPTWVSFEPVIDPEKTLELIKRVRPYVDDLANIKIGKLNTKPHNPKEVKDRESQIDWAKFYRDVDGHGYTIKDDLKAAAKPRKPNPDAIVSVQFKTDYQTDINGIMHQFHEGDKTPISLYRAKIWVERGVAEIVEASA
jgi:DNA primase large subunit